MSTEVRYGSTDPRRIGFIYFVECAGFIKIGFSVWPKARVDALQASCPLPMQLFALIPGRTQAEERDLHKRFAGFRVRPRQEWYRDDPTIRAYAAPFLVRKAAA